MPNIYFESMTPYFSDIIKKPSPSIYSVPKEWKNLPKVIDHSENVLSAGNIMADILPDLTSKTRRMCPAINDSFNFGYVIYCPVDIFIDSTDENSLIVQEAIDISPPNIYSMAHPIIEQKEVIDYAKSDFYHDHLLKIFTTFSVRTDPGYSCWFTAPISHPNLAVRAIDGIVDTDVFPADHPIPFLVKKNFKSILPAGTPILQIIPFKREDFYMVDDCTFDFNEAEKRTVKIKSMFKNSYKKNFWKRKKFL